MSRYEFEDVLILKLGPAEREWNARIVYQGGRWQADIERIEIRDPRTGEWHAVPWLIEAIEDSAALHDALRAHAVGRNAEAREVARETP